MLLHAKYYNATMLVTLKISEICMAYSDNELTELILNVAKHESGYEEILDWILSKKY